MPTPAVTKSIELQTYSKPDTQNDRASSSADSVSDVIDDYFEEASGNKCARCKEEMGDFDAVIMHIDKNLENFHAFHPLCATGKYGDQKTCPRCNPNRFCVIS